MPQALRTYRLCGKCLERQTGGGQAFEVVPAVECYICEGMTERTEKLAETAASKAKRYQFHSFSVGVTLPDGVQEREDELRSELKLKGTQTIKTQASGLLATRLSGSLGKRLDRQRPDLALLVDYAVGDVFLNARPLYFYGRYTKPPGVSQRRSLCENCQGEGCKKCRNTGFERKPSVEEALREKLGRLAGSDKMTFTWLGSEDRGSRVFPPGRPFVVEIKNPRKRTMPKKLGARLKGGLVSVSSGRMLPSKPLRLPSFRFLAKIRATAAAKVTAEGLSELRSGFRGVAVRFERPHNRPTLKTVYAVSAKARGRKLLIDARLDGGLPVKRFVSGELVSPSVSEVLKTKVSCRSFDICGVRETGEFGFAEITRFKEKD